MTFPGDSAIPIIEGTHPGVLDPSQSSRLLRSPTSHLLFATYDSHTACTGLPNLDDLHIDPNAPGIPKGNTINPGQRIVIETDAATWTCSWRFVPLAKTELGVEGNEGIWPRLVDFCGRTVRMSQDQWDLHKLDSEYECFVRAPPNLTTIRRKTPLTPANSPPSTPSAQFTAMPASAQMAGTTPTPKAKHPTPTFVPDTSSKVHTPQRMKTNDTPVTCPSVVMADPDEDAADITMVDAEIPSASSPPYKQGTKRSRFSAFKSSGSVSSSFGKRSQSSNLHEVGNSPNVKRTRILSPKNNKRQFERKQAERFRKRKAQLQAKFFARKVAMDRTFWEAHGVPVYVQETYSSHRTSDANEIPSEASSAPPSDANEPEDEATRQARIEESRRKLAELEKDRPLWEESKRRREAQEREEELRKQEKVKRETEEKERKRTEDIRKGREKDWYQQQMAREQERLLQEKSHKMFVSSSRGMLGWRSEHAFMRYVHTADSFDKASFEKLPITFASIPWPILESSFSVRDIEWEAVEKFFLTLQQQMLPADFKKLMVASHRRFHPDKWSARKVLHNVEDDLERYLLQEAGILVSQAITPIWEEVTR